MKKEICDVCQKQHDNLTPAGLGNDSFTKIFNTPSSGEETKYNAGKLYFLCDECYAKVLHYICNND